MAKKAKPEPAPDPTPAPPRTPGYNTLVLLLLALIGAAAYANSLDNPFIMRDIPRIVQATQAHGVGAALASRHPVTNLSYALNYDLGALDVVGYRIVNILIHVLAGLALYGLVRRTLTGPRLRDQYGNAAVGLAFAVAVIWLVHPLQTESVDYLAHRDTTLMGMFYLFTLYCIARAATGTSRGTGWRIGAVVCCALGMGSSAVMITAPLVALAYDRIYLSSSMSELMKRRGWMYGGLCAAWLLPIASGVVKSVLDASQSGATVGFGVKGVSAADYAMTQPGVLLNYFRLSLWPAPLCIGYDWNLVRSLWESGAIAIVVVAALLVWTIVMMIRRPTLGFIGLWFFVVAAPTSSVIPNAAPLAEYRMYLPLIAIIVLIVFGAHSFLRDLFGRKSAGHAVLGLVILLPVVAALFAVTAKRNTVYASELVMWEDVLAQRPNNPRALTAVAAGYLDRGKFDEGESLLRKALKLTPDSGEAHYQLGRRYSLQQMYEPAMQEFQNALKLGLNNADLYDHMGEAATVLGNYEESADYLKKALALDPDHVSALMHYGNTLFHLQRADEALKEFKHVLDLDPNNVEGLKQYSLMLSVAGRTKEAIAACDKALALSPDDEDAQWQRKLLEDRLKKESKEP